jgi:hypothetical protein
VYHFEFRMQAPVGRLARRAQGAGAKGPSQGCDS